MTFSRLTRWISPFVQALVGVSLSLIVGLTGAMIAHPAPALAAAPPEAASYAIALTPDPSHRTASDIDPAELDLDRAAHKTEEASRNVFQGIEKAKELKGKGNEANEQIIEQARSKASGKLRDLAQRARSTDDPETLNPVDRLTLKRHQDVK